MTAQHKKQNIIVFQQVIWRAREESNRHFFLII